MGFWLVDIGHSVGQKGTEQCLVDIGQMVWKGWSGKHWTLHSFKRRLSLKSLQLLKYEMLAICRLTGSQQDSSLRPYKFKSKYLCSLRAHKMWPPSVAEVASAILHVSLSLYRVSTERTGEAAVSCKWSHASCSPCLPAGYLGHCHRPTAYCHSHVRYATAGHDKITKDALTVLRANQKNCKMCASESRHVWPIVRINWRTAERIFMTYIPILTKIWHNSNFD